MEKDPSAMEKESALDRLYEHGPALSSGEICPFPEQSRQRVAAQKKQKTIQVTSLYDDPKN